MDQEDRYRRQVRQGGTAEASCSKVALKVGNGLNNFKIRGKFSRTKVLETPGAVNQGEGR